MFIYKITINDKIYIGFDTKQPYKEFRWKTHKRNAKNGESGKLYDSMRKYGINNCYYDVLEKDFKNITDLVIAEINYIAEYDSYKNGLNSTYGGDGYGFNIKNMPEENIIQIKQALSERLKHYNHNVKWKNTTAEERKEMCSHLNNEKIYKKKGKTLKKYWKNVDEEKRNHQLRGFKTQWKNLTYNEKLERTSRGKLFSPGKYEIIWFNGKKEIIENLTLFRKKYNINSLCYQIKNNKPYKNLIKSIRRID